MSKISRISTERLIVSADFKATRGQGREWVREQVLALADSLSGTGVYLKVNSALRACGYGLIQEIKDRGLLVFADLKLYDISETLSTDGTLLKEMKPELLTTVCSVGMAGLQALNAELPDTEVLGVTILTTLSETDTMSLYGCGIEEAVLRSAQIAANAGIGGLICSPKEVALVREKFGTSLTITTPGIRPVWSMVANDDQNPDRVMTPAQAIQAGADRIVIGRPILKDPDPRAAVMRTLEEIEAAF